MTNRQTLTQSRSAKFTAGRIYFQNVFVLRARNPSRILSSIKKKPVAQDVQITLKISHSTLKTLTFLSPDLHSLRTIWHHHHQWFYLIDWKVNPRLKTGFTHLRQEDILQLLFDLNRLRSSGVWMCLRDMRVCLCVCHSAAWVDV